MSNMKTGLSETARLPDDIHWRPRNETKADSSTQQLACLGCPVDMDEEAEAGDEPDDSGDEDDA